jgi:aspartyl-tRNA(Asn)/glutamyl-tRNA(Gln) amidotransferase subunit A
MKLYELGLKEAAAKIKAGEITSVELTTAILDRIETRNEALGAYVTICREKALEMAKASDERVKGGNPRLLEGVPLGIKDLYCTQGVLTTACSKILENFIPPYESTVTQNLWNSGAVLLGKLNMDEFAMGSTNQTSKFYPAHNPWDLTRTPGGSSGGSSAAVADYLCLGATGSDTGGSIRQPAAFTGIVGLKPTYGRCSRYGMVAFASSLDQAGPMARNVEDTALMFRAMSGFDEKDSTSADRAIENYDEKLNELDISGLKIGLPKEYFLDSLSAEVKNVVTQAVKRFEEKGATVVEISLPHTEYAVPTYYIVAPAEAAANLSRYDGMRYGVRIEGANLAETYQNSRSAGFGDEVKRRIMVGNYTLSSGYYDAYYTKAQKVRAQIAQDFDEAFEQVDVIFTPTTPTPSFKLDEKPSDPVEIYLSDTFTAPVNLAGLPAISVPAGTMDVDGVTLPLGLQIIGPAFSERTLLRAAFAHEQMAGFKPLAASE